MKICIYGCGMFGFALAKHFSEKFQNNPEYEIVSYDRTKEVVDHIIKTGSHPYHFTYAKINPKNRMTNSIQDLIHDCNVLILVVPSQSVREVTRNLKSLINKDIVIVNTAKALEIETNKRLSEVINEELSGIGVNYKIAQFSGGTIAQDIVNGAPLGSEIACNDIETCKMLQKLFSNRNLRVYINDDLIGVEYAGALKNVIAILAGIISGMKLPYGSETHMISRAAKEASEIAIKLGAKEYTFSMSSQSWGNDLWMSCTGNTRNRYFGELIGQGFTPEEAIRILKKEHKIAEGYYTTQLVRKLCEKTKYNSYILMEIYEILYNSKKCNISINQIMNTEI